MSPKIQECLSSGASSPLTPGYFEIQAVVHPPAILPNYPFMEQRPRPRTALLEHLPPRMMVDEFIRRYLDTIEKTHHLLPCPDI
jgi:hypothetical protein